MNAGQVAPTRHFLWQRFERAFLQLVESDGVSIDTSLGTGYALDSVMTHAALRRHLVLIVVVKSTLLLGIWWAFVKDARVDVETDEAASRILSTQGESPQ